MDQIELLAIVDDVIHESVGYIDWSTATQEQIHNYLRRFGLCVATVVSLNVIKE